MRIVILSPHFYPEEHPRAHRWTALSRYWANQGHELIVICTNSNPHADLDLKNLKVIRTGRISPFARGRSKTSRSSRASPVRRAMYRVYTRIIRPMFFPDESIWWYRKARKSLQEALKEAPDLLISVSMPFASHLIAYNTIKHYPGIPWIADVGDPLFHPWLRHLGKSFERYILNRADSIAVTCRAAADYYSSSPFSDRVCVIPPLWFPEIIPETKDRVREGLRIGYFGALYNPYRSPGYFLEILDQLENGLGVPLQFHWYGDANPEMAHYFEDNPRAHSNGVLPRKEVPEKMQAMDFLLHFGNKSPWQLPSKICDYLASGVPVIHIQNSERDPFLEEWGNEPGLFVLQEGEKNLNSLIRFMKDNLGVRAKRNPETLTRFRIHQISNKYLFSS